MKCFKTKQLAFGVTLSIIVGIFMSSLAPYAHAVEIKFLKVKYNKVQERVDLRAKEVSGLRFNQNVTQEALGRVILAGGPEVKIDQAKFGKLISLSGQVRWHADRAGERLIASVQELATVAAKEAKILGPGSIQERLGTMILANAQKEFTALAYAKIDDLYNAARHQEALGRQILREARLDWASGEMGNAVFATARGKITPAISGEVIQAVQTTGGFGLVDDFRIGLTLLAGERGTVFSRLMGSKTMPASVSAVTYADAGWGGFAEYGFATVAGFIFVMYLFAGIMIDVEPPVEKEEEKPYEYQKAA